MKIRKPIMFNYLNIFGVLKELNFVEIFKLIRALLTQKLETSKFPSGFCSNRVVLVNVCRKNFVIFKVIWVDN